MIKTTDVLMILRENIESSGLADGSIVVKDVWISARPEIMLTGHLVDVIDVSFSPNGRFLASIDKKGIVIVWSTKVSIITSECMI